MISCQRLGHHERFAALHETGGGDRRVRGPGAADDTPSAPAPLCGSRRAYGLVKHAGATAAWPPRVCGRLVSSAPGRRRGGGDKALTTDVPRPGARRRLLPRCVDGVGMRAGRASKLRVEAGSRGWPRVHDWRVFAHRKAISNTAAERAALWRPRSCAAQHFQRRCRGAALRQLSNCKWKREARPPQMERLLSL